MNTMMKSFIAVLPLIAGALAQADQCTQSTVTETLTDRITVTVPAQSAAPLSVQPLDTTEVVVSTMFVTPSPLAMPTALYGNGTRGRNSTGPRRRPSRRPTFVLPSSIIAAEGSLPTAVPSDEAVQSSSVSVGATSVAEMATSATPVAAPAASSDATPVSGSDSSASLSGEATFYGGNLDGGMCSFSGYTLPSGIFGTALSDSNWDTAGNCGACVNVNYGGKTIKAMVVDQCPGCGTNHLDLFQNAFTQLADASKGIIDVDWSFTSCGISSPITLKNKEGVSAFYFSMQVQNANVRVAKLEVSTDGGKTWQATTRKEYNYFESASGFGTTNVDVKVTSVNGDSVTVSGVTVASSATKAASGNFA